VSGTLLTVFGIGTALGSYLGYHVGVWRAATRAARATYRTQRNLR
jgi:hypothetical protein